MRSTSVSSSYQDFDSPSGPSSPNISRDRLHPSEARSHFSPAQIDARDVDFSDRLTAKRKSYKASTRRQRQETDEPTEIGDFSDDEDGESLERKMARLRREIEEVKAEVGRRKQEREERGDAVDSVAVDGRDDAAALSKMLEGMSETSTSIGPSAGERLAKDLATSLQVTKPISTSIADSTTPTGSATYTVAYAPTYHQSHALAKAADFDSRLTLLEKALGITSTTLHTLDPTSISRPILPTLDNLHRQVLVLSESSTSSLDTITRRVRILTTEAEKLDEARKSAKASQAAVAASASDDIDIVGMDSEQVAKVNALYGTLATIDNLAPLLPSVLDRLRSLRAIHADAATVSESLQRVEKRQEDMAADIKQWREGLEKVEEAMKQGEASMGSNIKVVEGWVKDLEERMSKMDI